MANPGRMQFREPAKKVLAKYEWGLGLDHKPSEAKIRPFQFEFRMDALNLRRSHPRGFEACMLHEDKRPKGPERPKPYPFVVRGLDGIRGWLQRLIAGRVIKEQVNLTINWHALSEAGDRIRREMLQDLVIVYRELEYFHEIANNRDLEAFETARKLSGERKNNEEIAKAYKSSTALLNSRTDELERLEKRLENQLSTLRGQQETIDTQRGVIEKLTERVEDYDKMIEVFEALAELEDDDEDEDPDQIDSEAVTVTAVTDPSIKATI